jgi:hypothetical protein
MREKSRKKKEKNKILRDKIERKKKQQSRE